MKKIKVIYKFVVAMMFMFAKMTDMCWYMAHIAVEEEENNNKIGDENGN